ncbi:hemerythrin domain-containing protein [uncultured Finegoldia sp.]|uniref:hemerythrin domain-containing protein n=1 Tax=uncultured Finegoldia sp. TaxID=328009 RepID=UPI002616AD7F|nr:hemerythrin domain-containing protein [uncultured Finegoldia sp.]
MDSILILEKEHENISKIIDLMKEKSIEFINRKEINVEFVKLLIVVLKEYADKFHHRKEEEILFKKMQEDLGRLGEVMIMNGMLVEHEFARGIIFDLNQNIKLYSEDKSDENFVEVIGNLMSYRRHLQKHIEKENTVVYPYGKNNLSKDRLKEVEEETIKFLEDNKEVHKELLKKIDTLFNM